MRCHLLARALPGPPSFTCACVQHIITTILSRLQDPPPSTRTMPHPRKHEVRLWKDAAPWGQLRSQQHWAAWESCSHKPRVLGLGFGI